MGNRKKSYALKTDLAKVIDIVRKLCVKEGNGREKLFVNKLAAFFIERVNSLNELNPCLKDKIITETQANYLKIVFLRTVLDLDSLRSLCLFPPRDTPFNKWSCFIGPCAGQSLLRSVNHTTLKHLRESCGLLDNLPIDFFEYYHMLWGSRTRPHSSKRKSSEDPLSPLLLFPVKAFSGVFKAEIIATYPVVRDFIDELFICCDHFSSTKTEGKGLQPPAPLRSATIFNYSLEYLRSAYDEGSIALNLGKSGSYILPFIDNIFQICRASPSVCLPGPVQFEAIRSSEVVRQTCAKMAAYPQNNFFGPDQSIDSFLDSL